MSANEQKDPTPPANPNEAVKPKPAIDEGTLLGEIDGVPHVMGADGKARPLDPPKVEPSAEDATEWLKAFSKQRDVEVETKGYRSSTGEMMPAVKAIVPYTSIRCVVAHRALHAMSPKQRKDADALVANEKDPHAALLKLLATSELMDKGGKDHPAVPHWHPATQEMIALHAAPARLSRHHAELAKKSAEPAK